MEQTSEFAIRPAFNSSGRKTQLSTNLFLISLNSTSSFYKYSVKIQPDLPGDAFALRKLIFRKCKSQVFEILGPCLFDNTAVYANKMVVETISVEINYKETAYTLKLSMVSEMNLKSPEKLIVLRKIIASVFGSLKFKPFKRDFIDTANQISVLNNSYLSVPSYSYKISDISDTQVALKIDTSYKIIRNETVLDLLYRYNSKGTPIKSVSDNLRGMMVMTRYNNDRSYMVEKLNLFMNPNSTFTKEGAEISFKDYFSDRYGVKINDLEQPLLEIIDRKNGGNIYLVPEMCYCTGISEEIKSNFSAMKEFNRFLFMDAQNTVDQCTSLIKQMETVEKAKEAKDMWQIEISKEPFKIESTQLENANFLVNQNSPKPLDPTQRESERTVLNNTFICEEMTGWGIFVSERDKHVVDNLLNCFKKACDSSRFRCRQPKVVLMRNMNVNDIRRELDKVDPSSVQMLVFVLSGPKKNCPLYSKVKELTMIEYPIPTQVICKATISKPNGLMSIVSKILLQMKVKIGATPWVIHDLPFTDVPTTAIGVAKTTGVTGVVTSMNRFFSSYYSQVIKEGEPIHEAILKGVSTFEASNGVPLRRIIVFYLGSEGNKALMKDIISPLKGGLLDKNSKAEIFFIKVDKNSKMKFFKSQERRFAGATQGTLIDRVVVSKDIFDFFIVTAMARQGMPKGIQFSVLTSGTNFKVEEIQQFCYKMCFLYYNWIGSIKLPAPCKLALKLAELVAQISGKSILTPSENLRTQYYI